MKKSLILFALSALMFTACFGSFDEKQAFIDANIEASCSLTSLEDLISANSSDAYAEIFKKHGFNFESQDQESEMFAKYMVDDEVVKAISAGAQECISKLDVITELGDKPTVEPVVVEPVVVEPVTDETTTNTSDTAL